MSTWKPKKPYKGLAMEGVIARWYARNTGKNIEDFRKTAQDIAQRVRSGSDVLEIAPGPGFLAIELAKLGPYRIVGLDISRSFVRLATENAIKAGVEIRFQEGNATSMPFESNSFAFVYCRAAFKNFSEPVEATREMHRVLRPGCEALIHDLRRDASSEAINAEVRGMGLGWFNSLMTNWVLRSLRKWAYSQDDFRRMVQETPFRTCEITCDGIGLQVSLRK